MVFGGGGKGVWGDGGMGDGEMGRWEDGEMGRWEDGEMGSVGEIKKYVSYRYDVGLSVFLSKV
ncbi:MAG: hypothetical protein F6K24_07285 [Okeania sp. SIO2D1]|nr:hypothetical protein [Okeania sp. SIO2D1]